MKTASQNVILKAILGPTNTGKTHYAVERMLARQSGVIGLPLRLLAREVYDRICAIKRPAQCALITGEEKIVPDKARYFVCTVESMPLSRRFAFVAIDEVQLLSNPERGHIFTDRLLHARGTEETLFLGAETARPVIRRLIPDAYHETRERFSTLSYSGPIKLTRLPKRSVIVAFSAGEVYALAELIRRFRGGAAIVMGGLSPRTRNAQAALYQSGEVDFLVATDAVGMGLNLDADHVAFASMRKFDGRRQRRLTASEAGQIAGRAGRFRNDGSFGPTGDCPPFDQELVARIEHHQFDPLQFAKWRNSALDYSSLKALRDSLDMPTPQAGLRRIAPATDESVLDRFSVMDDIAARGQNKDAVLQIWDVCQIPDFRNLALDSHIRLLREIYDQFSENKGVISDEYLNKHISRLDHIDGGVDILSARLAQIRTWTYCANKSDWLNDSAHWVERARTVEDRLSDALHEKLTARFVDKRTRALLRGANLGDQMETSIKEDGEVWVGEHKIGRLEGLKFTIDNSDSELEAKALRQAAEQALAPEVDRRLTSISGAAQSIFTLDDRSRILWGGVPVGRIAPSGSVFNPSAQLIGGELGKAHLLELAATRMQDYLQGEVQTKLAPLLALKALSVNSEVSQGARGLAYQLVEGFGHLDRSEHAKTIGQLDQNDRKTLRELGVVFGQYDVYLRELIRPKPARLLSQLLSYGAGGDGKPFIPFAGVTSIPSAGDFQADHFSKSAIFAAGYRPLGPRIIRFDILNRLAALIRQAQREAGTRRFRMMQEMLALLGSTYEEARGVLQALGYHSKVLKEEDLTDVRPELAAPVPTRFVESQTPNAKLPNTKLPDAKLSGDEPADEKIDISAAKAAKAEQDRAGKTDPKEISPEEAKLISKNDVKAESVPIHSAKRPQPKNKPLSVYHYRETAEDGTVTEMENREFWFLPFRKKTKGNFSRQNTPQRGSNPGGQSRGGPPSRNDKFSKSKNKRGGKPPKPGRSSGDYKAKEVRKDADSPFAALASLKPSLVDDKKTSKVEKDKKPKDDTKPKAQDS